VKTSNKAPAAGGIGAARRQSRRCFGHQGDSEFLTRSVGGPAGREAQERRSDCLSREPAVLPGPRRVRWV